MTWRGTSLRVAVAARWLRGPPLLSASCFCGRVCSRPESPPLSSRPLPRPPTPLHTADDKWSPDTPLAPRPANAQIILCRSRCTDRQSWDGMTARLPHRSSSTRVNECKLYFMLSFTDQRWLRRVYRSIRWKLMMLAIIFSGCTFPKQNTMALVYCTIDLDI